MAITISEALHIPVFKDAIIIAGNGGLGNVIKTVSVIETPDAFQFFQGGELFISSFYSVKDDVNIQINMLTSMKEVGSAGLIICNRERIMKEISLKVIEYADFNDLPIIEIRDPNVLYYHIINEVMEYIIRKDAFQLENNIYKEITKHIIRGEGYLEIFKSIENIIKNPLVVLDHKLSILYRPSDIEMDLVNQVLDLTDLNLFVNDGSKFTDKNWFRLKLSGYPHTVIVIPFDFDDVTKGCFLIFEILRKIEEWQVCAIQEATLLFSLEQSRFMAVKEVERRLQKGFLEEILYGRITSKEDAKQRGNFFGLDLILYNVLLLLEIDNEYYADNRDQNKRIGLKSDGPVESNVVEKIKYLVNQVVYKEHEKNYIIDKTNGVVILPYFTAETDPRNVLKKAIALAKKIAQYIQERLNEVNIRIGISDYFNNIDDISVAYKQAKEVINIARHYPENKPISWFIELEGYILLSRLKNEKVLKNFYERVYNPINEHDYNYNTELAKTLEMYFICAGNSSEVAKRLYVHRNTIKYRKKQIKDILGFDPFVGSISTRFFLATMIKQLFPNT